MPELRYDDEIIAWHVRFSSRAKRVRIVVDAEKIEVVAPVGTPVFGPGGIERFVDKKREWIRRAVHRWQTQAPEDTSRPYTSGARFLFRRRLVGLQVTPEDVDEASVLYRGRFLVRVPRRLDDEDRARAVRSALHSWMMDKAERDATRWVRHYAQLLGVEPTGIRMGNQKTLWGSCGKHGALSINWRLVQAPSRVMEYVAAHEVCHLVRRGHSKRFWQVVSSVLPDWRERRAELRRWERRMARGGRLD